MLTKSRHYPSGKYSCQHGAIAGSGELLRFAGVSFLILAASLGFAQTKPGLVTGHVTVGQLPQSSPPVVSGSAAATRNASASAGSRSMVVTPAPGVKQVRASTPHLYWHFLMYQNHLDRAAAAHEKQNKDGSWLRNHLQQRLGFTDEQFAPIRATAQRLEPELAAIKAKAMVIAKDNRAWFKAQGIDIHALLAERREVGSAAAIRSLPQPPGHAQLRQLQQDFESTIEREVDSLKNDLGPELASRLDDQIQNEWAGQVTTLRIQPGKLRGLRTPVSRGTKP